MYTTNDIFTDVKNIINEKFDKINPGLFDALLSDYSGTSDLTQTFLTELSRTYLDTLKKIPSHPAIIQGIATSRPSQLEAINKEIEREKELMAKTLKKFDGKISKLERYGPRRSLQRLRKGRDYLIEIIQKRIDNLQDNPEKIADSRTLVLYGLGIVDRVFHGLAGAPLATRAAFFSCLRINAKNSDYLETDKLYDLGTSSAGVTLMAFALGRNADNPKMNHITEAMNISRDFGESLSLVRSKPFPARIFRPTINLPAIDLTTPIAKAVVDFLPQVISLQATTTGFEIKGRHDNFVVDSAQLNDQCPGLGSLLASLTSNTHGETPENAAMYLCGTVHHWNSSCRFLPGHKDAYIDGITHLGKESDDTYLVHALVHIVEKRKDGVAVASPPLQSQFKASRDWLNAAYPGAVPRLAIAESLGMVEKELRDYVFSPAAPSQDINLAELSDINFF